MKGIILCGGKGSRLRPITLSLPKQLIPIVNKPILFYIIDSFIESDIYDIGIIVNNNEEVFKEALKYYNDEDINITYINQQEPLGLADAVLKAEEFVKDDNFLMVLGDNFYNIDIRGFIDSYLLSKTNCKLMLKEVKDPQRYGIAYIEDDKIKNLIEKPKNPLSNLAITGIYLFDNNIFKACKSITPSLRGELEITDAIRWLLYNGYDIGYEIIKKGWEDLGKPEDIIQANKNKLKTIEFNIQGFVENECEIIGDIKLGKNSKIINSIIIGPVTIGENTVIKNSIIGPYVSINDECYIENSQIQSSIILDRCQIENITNGIYNSIIGSDSVFENRNKSKKGYSLILGKDSKIILNEK